MYIKKIILENFRNYKNEEIEFDEKLNIIVGENAQGKTSLLEGVYLCSFGKSFRTSKDKEMINFGKDFFRIKGFFQKEDEEIIEFALSKEGKKAAKINGLKVEKISDIISDYFVVIFSPEDLKIIKEDPEKRRNFIDRELCQLKVAYYDSLLKYKKLLKQRNYYLKEDFVDTQMLDVWDMQLAKEGSKIIHWRKNFVEKIGRISANIHNKITDGKEKPSFVYVSGIEYNEDITEQEKIFYDTLLMDRERDMYHRNTGKGPHKDDIDIFIDGKNVRKYGSQGQQRTVALSIKLAEIEIIKEESKEYPILLLDDVLSELDEKRQKYLFESIENVQVLITATELPEKIDKEFKDNKKVMIKDGKILR